MTDRNSQTNLIKVFLLPFQITNDLKISLFQYTIIHNILPTTVSLFKAKTSDNDIYPQCFTERHSVDHVFTLLFNFIFLSLFQNWWVSRTKENITLSNSMILYGIFDNRKHMYSLNYTLLIVKYSIYSKCLHDQKLYFDGFLSLLMEKVNVQREIAIQITNLLRLMK